MKTSTTNPFAVQTPEDISAQEAHDLFVDVFSDFYNVPKPGHTFLHGPRGSGKSMMFRYMLPDCQALELKKPLPEHSYFSVYIPIKKTNLNLIDLERIHKHANSMLNEHLLVTYISDRVFSFLSDLAQTNDFFEDYKADVVAYFKRFCNRVESAGFYEEFDRDIAQDTTAQIFEKMQNICGRLYLEVVKYVRKLAFLSSDFPAYSGSICGYLDFLYPLLCELKKIKFMPSGPIFILIDDADNLNLSQTMVLNNWVSYRTSVNVSLKISTQLNYKTFRTGGGLSIDSPHDYNEVNTETIYTSSKEKYKERVSAIVRKRLKNAEIDCSPEDFFPTDAKQDIKIKTFADAITEGQIETPNGSDKDKVYRYATSEYIKSLRGKSKNGMTYRYAGFKTIVNVSSGVIRHFLELASRMYSDKLSNPKTSDMLCIDPTTQDKIIRKYSEEIFLNDFDKIIEQDLSNGERVFEQNNNTKLRNLIEAMGGIFQAVLLSNASQRRIFSIALTDPADKEVDEVLKLGVRYGFLHEATIGNKEGTGRTKRYVLSRRLAPTFSLVPTSFAGYLFITNKDLKAAIRNPKSFVVQYKKEKRWLKEDQSTQTNTTPSLFD